MRTSYFHFESSAGSRHRERTHDELNLELATMLDMRELVRMTYELEGGRLKILLVHEPIDETLRTTGLRIIANNAC